MAGMDFSRSFSQQDLSRKAEVYVQVCYMHANSLELIIEYVQARLEHPYLASYQGDRVTAEILKQVLKTGAMHGTVPPMKPTPLQSAKIEYTKLKAWRKRSPDENSQHGLTHARCFGELIVIVVGTSCPYICTVFCCIYVLCEPLGISVKGMHINCIMDSKNQSGTQ
jgi:hypothetical protein